MATQMKKEIICPKCENSDKITMQIGMVNTNTGNVKEQILDESLFDWQCPNCGYNAQITYPLVYSDPIKNYMLILTPVAGQSANIKSVDVLENATKRRVKSLAELKEKILIFDAELDDIAIELVKESLSLAVKESYNASKVKLYFAKQNEDKSLDFAIFLSGKKTAIYQTAKYELYVQFLELLLALEFSEDMGEFLRVGPSLARKIIENSKIASETQNQAPSQTEK